MVPDVLCLRSLKALATGALLLCVSSADAQPRDAADAQQALQELGRVVDSQRQLIEELGRTMPERADSDGSDSAEKPFFERVKDIFG